MKAIRFIEVQTGKIMCFKKLKIMKQKKNENYEIIIYLSIVEYTSQRIPPVQYINMFVFSLSTFDKGSEAVT